MSNYYDNQESVANIAVGLMNRDWKVYGYRGDESDSMTDYWSPARWGGIAAKDGYVLLVDVYGTHDSGFKRTTQGYTPDWNKIEKLRATINDPAATENEKAVCQNKIDSMMDKQKESTIIIEEYPTFSQGNPKGCNWHIEKDGEIIAKGKGAFQCDGYLFGGYEEETMKKVNAFIDKIEDHIKDNSQLVAVQKEVIKKVIKPVETNINLSDFVKNETVIILNSRFTGGHYQGEVLQLIEVREYNDKKLYTFVKLGKKYQQLKRYGAANNTLLLEASRLEKWLNDETILTAELKEVEEVTYKTVYKKAQRKGQKDNLLQGETVEETQAKENVKNDITVELIHNQDKNGIELKFSGIPSEGTRQLLKENGFRWSKYNKVWFKKYSEAALMFAEGFVSAFNDITITEEQEQPEKVVSTQETINNDITETTQPIEEILINDSKLIGRKIFGQWGIMAGWDNGIITGETIYNEVVIKWEDGHQEYFEIKDLIFVNENTNMDAVGVYLLPVEEITESQNNITASKENHQEETEQEEIKNIYFKEWNMSKEDIEKELNKHDLIYTFNGSKFFVHVTPETYQNVYSIISELNKTNQAMIFDSEIDYIESINNIIYNSQPEKTLDLQYFSAATLEKEQITEEEGINKMSSILNKFDNITIENDKRISDIDMAFCEKQERMYIEAVESMKQTLEAFQNIYNNYSKDEKSYYKGYIEEFKDIRHTEDRINDFKNKFIYNIINHFQNAYNVSLESGDIIKKYKDTEITYQMILDEIFDQLGGFSFNEKAIQEIKDNIAKEVRHEKIEIKNNKLIIPSFIYIDHFDKKWGHIRMSYGSRDKVTALFTALSHFEEGSKEMLWYYQNIRQSLNDDNSICKYEIGHNKVQSFRPFQNGKVEIVFQSNEQAQQFKNEYLTN